MRPTAAAEDAFEARAHVHADITAAGPRSTLLKLIANLCTVTHRKVVEHVARVDVLALLDLTFLLFVEDTPLPQIGVYHQTISLLTKCQNRFPYVHLRSLGIEDDLADD